MEGKAAAVGVQGRSKSGLSKLSKSSKLKCSSSKEHWCVESSDSSDNEKSVTDLSYLRLNQLVQKCVDQWLAQLEQNAAAQAKCSHKIKSKRAGSVGVLVERHVPWPQYVILGGSSRQRLMFNQLTLSQFIQGFAKTYLMNLIKSVGRKCKCT